MRSTTDQLYQTAAVTLGPDELLPIGSPDAQFSAAALNNFAHCYSLAIESLVSLLSSPDEKVQSSSASALCNLIKSAEQSASVRRGGAIPPLIAMLSSKSAECQSKAVHALSKLSLDEEIRSEIIANGGEAKLRALLKSSDVKTRTHAFLALAMLARSLAKEGESGNMLMTRLITEHPVSLAEVLSLMFSPSINVVQMLLDVNHSAVNDTGDFGQSALLWAAYHGYEYICELLVMYGADVNLQARNGWTCLMAAAEADHGRIFSFLLSAGADPQLTTCERYHIDGSRVIEAGATVADVALAFGATKCLDVLQKYSARKQTVADEAAFWDPAKLRKELVDLLPLKNTPWEPDAFQQIFSECVHVQILLSELQKYVCKSVPTVYIGRTIKRMNEDAPMFAVHYSVRPNGEMDHVVFSVPDHINHPMIRAYQLSVKQDCDTTDSEQCPPPPQNFLTSEEDDTIGRVIFANKQLLFPPNVISVEPSAEYIKNGVDAGGARARTVRHEPCIRVYVLCKGVLSLGSWILPEIVGGYRVNVFSGTPLALQRGTCTATETSFRYSPHPSSPVVVPNSGAVAVSAPSSSQL